MPSPVQGIKNQQGARRNLCLGTGERKSQRSGLGSPTVQSLWGIWLVPLEVLHWLIKAPSTELGALPVTSGYLGPEARTPLGPAKGLQE